MSLTAKDGVRDFLLFKNPNGDGGSYDIECNPRPFDIVALFLDGNDEFISPAPVEAAAPNVFAFGSSIDTVATATTRGK